MSKPKSVDIKKHFEANILDGDEVQGGQMISSEAVLEYLQDSLYELLVSEVIGVDDKIRFTKLNRKNQDKETHWKIVTLSDSYKIYRNKLRAEQRQKLARLFNQSNGEDEK